MVLLHSSRGPVAIWAREPAFLATSFFPPQTIKGDSSKVTVCFQPVLSNKILFKLSFLVQPKSITCNRRRLSQRFSNYGPGNSTKLWSWKQHRSWNSILWAMQTRLSLDVQTLWPQTYWIKKLCGWRLAACGLPSPAGDSDVPTRLRQPWRLTSNRPSIPSQKGSSTAGKGSFSRSLSSPCLPERGQRAETENQFLVLGTDKIRQQRFLKKKHQLKGEKRELYKTRLPCFWLVFVFPCSFHWAFKKACN